MDRHERFADERRVDRTTSTDCQRERERERERPLSCQFPFIHAVDSLVLDAVTQPGVVTFCNVLVYGDRLSGIVQFDIGCRGKGEQSAGKYKVCTAVTSEIVRDTWEIIINSDVDSAIWLKNFNR